MSIDLNKMPKLGFGLMRLPDSRTYGRDKAVGCL